MEESQIIYEKNDTKIIKKKYGIYNLTFSIENKKMIMASILNFDLIKLIYDLNQDICEKVNLEKYDETTATITVLLKNFGVDLGLPQKYSSLQITRIEQPGYIMFNLATVELNSKPVWINDDLELADIKSIKISCNTSLPHKTVINCLIDFKEDAKAPAFLQKITIMMVNKIINRLKQFIENVAI